MPTCEENLSERWHRPTSRTLGIGPTLEARYEQAAIRYHTLSYVGPSKKLNMFKTI